MTEKFYPIAIWEPTQESLDELESNVESLAGMLTERKDYIASVYRILERHCLNVNVLIDILNEEYIQQVVVAASDKLETEEDKDVEIPEEDDTESTNEADDEDRVSKGVSRDRFKKCRRKYYDIMKICHPDVAKDESLWPIALAAQDAMAEYDLRLLTVLLRNAKDLNNRITAIRTVTPMLRKFFELQDEYDALNSQLEELAEEYGYVKEYAKDPKSFREAALQCKVEDLKEVVLKYKNVLTLEPSIKARIKEFLPDVFETHAISHEDPWANLANNRKKMWPSYDDIFNLLNDEEGETDNDEDDEDEPTFGF